MKKFTLWMIGLFAVFAVHSQEMPRISPWPASVNGIKECSFTLDGVWKFQTSTIRQSAIEVPSEWTMQGFDVPEGETAVYTRSFTIPEDWRGQRVKIRFDGVSSYGLVKVNGTTVGEHEGGMVPFEIDITGAVKPGNNHLRVEVKANTVSDRLGCISQYAVHTVGGLVRKVTLFALPQTNIASQDVVTTLDKSYKNAKVDIYTSVAREAAGETARSEIKYALIDETGKEVATAKSSVGAGGTVHATMAVRNARLWNPEQPYLYTLASFLYVDGQLVQHNQQKIGLRQVAIKGNRLLVNGTPVKLHGVNRHETHPLRGRSLTPELCRKDAQLFRDGNCNYIRTSHYPPSEEFLDACDELGLFVECEAAITWIQHHASPIWKLWNYEDGQYLPYLIRANLDNIAANRHHPSIIIWSLGNESRWSKLWEQVLATVKKADPSRPTSFHDQCWGGFNNAGSRADIANIHYPGINGPAACDTMKRPTLFGEYAHLSCYSRPELATDPGVRAAYGKPLQQMYDSMYHHKGCLGGAIWSGIDDIFHLAYGRILGYGPWGPVDGWRRVKPEYTGMKKAYTPFRLLEYKWQYDNRKKTHEVVLDVENRYDFTDLSQATIEYGRLNGVMKKMSFQLQPQSRGKITVTVDPSLQELYLRVTDHRGFVCAEELLASGEAAPVEQPRRSAFQLQESDDRYVISGPDKTRFCISKLTGLITQSVKDSLVIMQQGPVFCLVPMNWDDGGKPNVAGETYQNNLYPIKDYPFYTLFANNTVAQKNADGSILVQAELAFNEGHSGKISYLFGLENQVEISYEVTAGFEQEVSPRQYGLLMQVPVSFQTLTWERKGEFSIYPGNDIARTSGKARLNVRPLYEVEAWREVPAGDWKDDANYLGSVDFRSTKTRIRTASLSDDSGNGITVKGDGTQAIRAWLQDGCIQLLVADYNNNGSEPFYGSPFTAGRTKVKKGDVLKGKVTISIK